MTETGTTVNNAPEIEMELSMTLPNGNIGKVRHRCFVSLLDLARLSPGTRLQATVDPEDPARMLVITTKANQSGTRVKAPRGNLDRSSGCSQFLST